MHTRILIGVAAWLLGAATATGGSLLAVSVLGQGITGTGGLLLTPDGVNRALASDTASPSAAAGPATPGSQGGTRPAAPDGNTVPSAAATSASPLPTAPSSAPQTTPAGGAGASAAVLTSRGGDVVASCLAAGVYLDSWSPLSGYEVGDVSRGPAATAQVTFGSAAGDVTMVVSCSAGVPSVTTSSGAGWHDE